MKKKRGKSRPTQRSLKHLEDNKWSAHVVEKWIPVRGDWKRGKRVDCFGFGDILACRPPLNIPYRAGGGQTDVVRIPGRIALVQTTTGHGGTFAEHRRKIRASAKYPIWKAAGGLVFLHGWRFGGKRGEKKRWILREEEI